jgi:hypothetical protein
VVFTDVDMPGRLNGFQLARHIQDHHQPPTKARQNASRQTPSKLPI